MDRLTEQQPKKVCFVIEDVLGGVTMSVLNLIAHIDKSRLHCTVLLIQHVEWNNDSIRPLLTKKQLPFRHVSVSANANLYYNLKKIKKALRGFDVVVASNIDEMEAINRFKLPVKLIYAMHADNPYEYGLANLYQGVIDGFHAVSAYIGRTAEAALKVKKPVEYIPHAMPPSDLKMDKQFDGLLHLIFVGRFIKTKGSEELLELKSLLEKCNTRVRWTFVTNGKNEKDFRKRWGDTQTTKFYTNIPNQQVYELYKAAHAMVLPTRVEGFPLALIEAMNHGVVPLVTPLESGVPELVTHRDNGYLIPFDAVNEYVNAINELDNERVLLQEMSNRCREKIRNEFNPTDKAAQFVDFVYSILNQPDTTSVKRTYFKNTNYHARLDRWYVPNGLVYAVRKLKKLVR